MMEYERAILLIGFLNKLAEKTRCGIVGFTTVAEDPMRWVDRVVYDEATMKVVYDTVYDEEGNLHINRFYEDVTGLETYCCAYVGNHNTLGCLPVIVKLNCGVSITINNGLWFTGGNQEYPDGVRR